MMLKSLKRFRLNLSEKFTNSNRRHLSAIHDAIAKALYLGVPFAAYSLPGQKLPVFIADPDFGNPAEDEAPRFIIRQWMSADPITLVARMNESQFMTFTPCDMQPRYPALQASTSYMEYLDKVGDLVDLLKRSNGKCVISRVDSYSDPFFDISSMAGAFISAVKNYPDLMVYIFYTPLTGCWMAATPESLVESDGRGFSTMALAGTVVASDNPVWDEKNTREHDIVVEDISRKLSRLGLDFYVSEKETFTAGNNMHLLTRFSGSLGKSDADTIARTLHPTPAIAGYPLDESIEQINNIERHQRRCYCGTVTVENGSEMKSYVTLRCVEFSPKGYAFYAGGGITGQSVPSEEWIETARKISTIASVMPPTR